MATLEDVRDHLLLDETLTGLVADRIYAMRRPQGSVLPAVVYQLISMSRPDTWTGPQGNNRQRIQFSIWSTEYGEAYEIGKAIILSLDTFTGALFENQRDLMDVDNVYFGRAIDFHFWLDNEE